MSNRKASNTYGLIYMWKCLLNGKCYIGQTKRRLKDREWQHVSNANKGIQTRFYHALRKYGREGFLLGILEENTPIKELNNKEEYYINIYGSYVDGYNATIGGNNQAEFTEERIGKLREASTGRKLSQETKDKIGKVHRGKVMTISSKQQISITMKDKGIAKGTSNNSFKPWWYEVGGIKTIVQDMTISDYEKCNGINKGTLIVRFNKKKIGKEIKSGMFKGMRFGHVEEGNDGK